MRGEPGAIVDALINAVMDVLRKVARSQVN
jgi:hypothetical protein